MSDRKFPVMGRVAIPLLLVAPVLGATAAAAQSYAVVQPLPSPAAGELNEALRRLARSPGDFDALIAAGRASLAVGDVDAANGFFGRADAVRPGDARVKAGLALVNLRSDRPIEALQLFDQAQAAGAPPASLAGDRGLAFDLVGDNASAQAQYRLALTQGPDPEISRRLGLSQAIAGDKKGFEATLLPLLQRRDFAAYRARAFGLAILGEEAEAISIAEAVMPRDLSSRVTPYLRYMPRLTRAQQAATGNLGAFPKAAQIGRDDPRFAQFAGPASVPVTARGGDSRLAPAGAPLGPKPQAAPATVAAQTPARTTRGRERTQTRRALSPAEERRLTLGVTPAATPTPAPTSPNVPESTPAPIVVARADPPAPMVRQAAPPPPPPPPAASPVRSVELPPQPVATIQVSPSVAAPGFQTVQSIPSQPAPVVAAPVVVLSAPPPAAPPPEVSVADAFADLAITGSAAGPVVGAVDITAIKPRREVAEVAKPAPPPPPPPAAKPKVPSRIWVQVATGKDVNALAFDWRKFGKKAPELLAKRSAYTAKWGETRRLVTGPFDSGKAANQMVADLKKAGLDAFVFTSEAGEDVAPLK